jgi:AraC-like DNA-binding protein
METVAERFVATLTPAVTKADYGIPGERPAELTGATRRLRLNEWLHLRNEESAALAGGHVATEKVTRQVPRGGLAPWKARRIVAHMEANLSDTISVQQLAALVRLSSSHFSRMFTRTFGISPHAWLMRRRLQVAQNLMLKTDAPLSDIALSCGMSDQSHLTHLFTRCLGETPSSWRRTRRAALRLEPINQDGSCNRPTGQELASCSGN